MLCYDPLLSIVSMVRNGREMRLPVPGNQGYPKSQTETMADLINFIFMYGVSDEIELGRFTAIFSF